MCAEFNELVHFIEIIGVKIKHLHFYVITCSLWVEPVAMAMKTNMTLTMFDNYYRGSPHSRQNSQWLQPNPPWLLISAKSSHFLCTAFSFSELQSQQYSPNWLKDFFGLGNLC